MSSTSWNTKQDPLGDIRRLMKEMRDDHCLEYESIEEFKKRFYKETPYLFDMFDHFTEPIVIKKGCSLGYSTMIESNPKMIMQITPSESGYSEFQSHFDKFNITNNNRR